MATVLVTGGTGGLGRDVAARLAPAGHQPRIFTRQIPAEGYAKVAGAEVARGDLVTGAGLDAALDGVDAIIHCASDPRDPAFAADVVGTRELVSAAQAAGAPHIVYISIVGVGQSDYPYYVAKREAETVIERSTLPWTILRTTQFHPFVQWLIQGFIGALDPHAATVIVPAGVRMQPVDRGEVADRLVALMEQRAVGHAPDMAGPETLSIEELTEAYLRWLGRPAVVEAQPLPFALYDLLRSGVNLAPAENATGVITWRRFLHAILWKD